MSFSVEGLGIPVTIGGAVVFGDLFCSTVNSSRLQHFKYNPKVFLNHLHTRIPAPSRVALPVLQTLSFHISLTSSPSFEVRGAFHL